MDDAPVRRETTIKSVQGLRSHFDRRWRLPRRPGCAGCAGCQRFPGFFAGSFAIRHYAAETRDIAMIYDRQLGVESPSLSLSLSLSLSFVEKRNRYEGEKERNKVAQTYALGAYLWFGRRQMFWAHTYGLGAYLWFGRRRMLWAHTFGLRADVCFGQIKVEIVAFF